LPPGKLAKMGSESSARVITLALDSDPIFSTGNSVNKLCLTKIFLANEAANKGFGVI